ncbi:MAG TPA: carbohydrate-binding domain-containing protein, partial [Rhodopila sp.]|nr:carbohydrate-binding domain-containing protein [Rhodopila sp.]
MSVNVGYGSDEITLNMAEDSAAGQDAEFTVNVDGQQIGGVQTVTAEQSQGQTESFNFFGDYAPGEHNVTVTFVNNYLYPGTPGDRNVYVDGVSYDGSTVSSSTTPIYQSPWFPPNSIIGDVWGNAVYGVNDTTAIPAGATPEQTTTPGAVSVGNGPDKLVLQMAEDPY